LSSTTTNASLPTSPPNPTTAAPTTTTTTTAAPTTTTEAPTTTEAELTVPELYAATCARCHGDDLEGGIGPSLRPEGHAHGHSDAELIAIVTNGKNGMPAFAGELTEEQITDLISFIRAVETEG
jgi:cytochrome c551